MNADLSRLIATFGAMVLAGAALGQSGPPAPSSLEDISGCSLDGDNVFISTGRDATARRYRYPYDAAIDALCNAKGFAIGSPAKAPATAPSSPRSPIPISGPSPSPAIGTAPGVPSDFPPDAVSLSADALAKRLAGKTFDSVFANGTAVRLEYKASGYMFVNAPGFASSGTWRAEDGRICSQLKGREAACNEVREKGQQLYLKRDSGEVMAMNPR